MIDKHPNRHPLVALFHSSKFTISAGMDWLQNRGHISDLCQAPEDAAPCDVEAVLRKAGALCFIPKWPWIWSHEKNTYVPAF